MATAAKSPIAVERVQLGRRRAFAVVVRLDRPEQLNAIDATMLRALDGTITDIEADPAVRAVLVTGNGRAFSAGGDLTSYVKLQRDPVAFPRFVADLHATFGRLRTLPVPVIALVNGVTAAGGLELMLNCDFALVARVGPHRRRPPELRPDGRRRRPHAAAARDRARAGAAS